VRPTTALGLLALLSLACACSGEADPGPDTNAGAVTTSRSDDHLIEVPFYFAVPKASVNVTLNRDGYSFPTMWNPSTEVDSAGLRLIVVKEAGQAGAQKKVAHEDMARQLARAGVLLDGDIALSFRPEYANTKPYPHLQMGVTHASLVYTENGEAKNIDSPLDSEFVGQFNTAHFIGKDDGIDHGTDALQIIRPNKLDDARRTALRGWVLALRRDIARVHGQMPFQSNYLTPVFDIQKISTKQTVTKLGKIILGTDKTATLPVYCSEFAWHMLALSACSEDDIKNAGPEGADCVDPMFDPMPISSSSGGAFGLADGPLTNLMLAPADKRGGLVAQLFRDGDAAKLSSGHRQAAEQVEQLGIIKGLLGFYSARASEDAAQADGIAAGLNAKVVGNYSPSAYMAQATRPQGERPMDYVATVVFIDSADDLAKAKRLSKLPIP
jgi:hypothetical protein